MLAAMGSPEAIARVRLGRIVIVAWAVGLLVLAGLPEDIVGSRTALPLWMWLVLGFEVVCSTVVVLLAERILKPLERGLGATKAQRRGAGALLSLIFVRIVAAITPAMIALGLAAIAQTVTKPFLIMVPVSLALLAVAWPRAALVRSVRDRLERGGAAS